MFDDIDYAICLEYERARDPGFLYDDDFDQYGDEEPEEYDDK